jgi:glycyl-tRNA synthetase beta subunit
LRRSALGVLRILIETPLDLDLRRLLEWSASALAPRVEASRVIDEVLDYAMERLRGYYADRNVPTDVVESVLALRPTVPQDADRRIQAVTRFRASPAAESLAAAHKRLRNMLRKAGEEAAESVRADRLQEPRERELYRELERLQPEVEELLVRRDYLGALSRLARLRTALDGFFDQVMVLCDDPELRSNRLALLETLGRLFDRVADLSRLQ